MMIRFDVTIVDSGCLSKSRIRLILQSTYCNLRSYPWHNISDRATCALITNQIHFGTNKNQLLSQSYNQHLRFFGGAINGVCSLFSWYMMLKVAFCYLLHTDRRSCWVTDASSNEMRSLPYFYFVRVHRGYTLSALW